MKWFFAALASSLVILVAGLAIVGFRIVRVPKPHDPFPPEIRARLDSLNDTRHEIEWLAAKARIVGQGNKLPQEKQDYDELARDANAWLKSVGEGLAHNKVDTVFLTGQFEERVIPKAKQLTSTLESKMRWMGPERFDAGILKVATTETDHIISVLNYGWEDVSTYFKSVSAGDAESRKLAMGQLDDMKWVPWTEVMAEQF
jgi:hypothetical protein